MKRGDKIEVLKKDPLLSLFNLFEIKKDQPVVEYSYLSPELASKSGEFSELSMKVKKHVFVVDSLTAQTKILKNHSDEIHIDSLRKVEHVLGHEIKTALKSSAINEVMRVAVKSKAFKDESRFTKFLHSLWGYESLVRSNDLTEIFKLIQKTRYNTRKGSLRGDRVFIIVDPYSASYIQDTPQFKFNSDTVKSSHNIGHTQLIGEFLDMPVFINYDLKDELIIGAQPTRDKASPIVGLAIGEMTIDRIEIVNEISMLPETIVQAKLQNAIISVEDTKNFYECVKVGGESYPDFWSWVKLNPFNVFKNFFSVIGTSIRSLFEREREESPKFG